jgi:photosystem II stability/assembly factor-like uncharacterized protein
MTRARSIIATLATACAAATATAWGQVGHWTPVSDPGIQVIAASPDGGAWFALSGTTGLRTVDRGANWAPLDFNIREIAESPGTGTLVGVSALGIYYSNDAGGHWTRSASPPVFDGTATQLSALAPIGAQPGLMYATRGFTDGLGAGFVPEIVIRSRDGGATWQDLDAAGFRDSAPSVAPSPVKAGLVFVGNTAGVYRSRDGGDTWLKVRSAPALPGGNRVVADRSDSRVAYAVTTSDVWVTEDEGDTWRQGAPLHVAPRLRVLADPATSRRLWIVSSAGEVFETRDAARSWSQHTIRGETTLGSVGINSELLPGPAVAVIAGGTSRTLMASQGSTNTTDVSYELDVSSQRLVIGPDLWFNPQQPGWGLSLIQHASGQLFAVWFTYTAEGNPTWLYMPGGTWTDANTFVADLYQAQGTPYNRNWQTNEFFFHLAGSGTLRFNDRNSGSASFTLKSGGRFDSPISRMYYGPRPPSYAAWSAMGDLYYNPSESGWGLALHQQYGTTFGTWFTFGTNGEPTWFVMPNGLQDVYRPTARPGTAYSPTGVTVSRVGTSSITGLPEVRFNFTVDGYSSWSRIERMPY